MTKLADYKKIASQIKKGEVRVLPEEIERLRLEKERIEKERVRREILEKISENSQFDIPQEFIEREKGLILDNLKHQVSHLLHINFEEYLKRIKKSEKELLDSLTEEAKKRISGFLMLRAIAERENIQVQAEEVNQELDNMTKNFPDANIDQGQLREYTKDAIRNEKTFQFLENL